MRAYARQPAVTNTPVGRRVHIGIGMSRVYVGTLDPNITKEQLEDEAREFGKARRARSLWLGAAGWGEGVCASAPWLLLPRNSPRAGARPSTGLYAGSPSVRRSRTFGSPVTPRALHSSRTRTCVTPRMRCGA